MADKAQLNMPHALFVAGMSRHEFVRAFVASFCASWCANNYNEFCTNGQQEKLSNPPLEDAVFMAEAAYDKWYDLSGMPKMS